MYPRHCLGTEQQRREQHLGNHLVFLSRDFSTWIRDARGGLLHQVPAHCHLRFSSLFFVWALPQFYPCRKSVFWLPVLSVCPFVSAACLFVSLSVSLSVSLLFLCCLLCMGLSTLNVTVLPQSHNAFLPFHLVRWRALTLPESLLTSPSCFDLIFLNISVSVTNFSP